MRRAIFTIFIILIQIGCYNIREERTDCQKLWDICEFCPSATLERLCKILASEEVEETCAKALPGYIQYGCKQGESSENQENQEGN